MLNRVEHEILLSFRGVFPSLQDENLLKWGLILSEQVLLLSVDPI